MKRHNDFPSADFAAFNILRRVFIPPKTASWDVDGEVVTVQSKLGVRKNPDTGQSQLLHQALSHLSPLNDTRTRL